MIEVTTWICPLLWSHTTHHSNTRTAQLEMTTFSGLHFLKLEPSHGTWVNSSSDQPSAQFSSHYQVIRSFVNLSKPLPALKFWNLILEKWETTSREEILVKQTFRQPHSLPRPSELWKSDDIRKVKQKVLSRSKVTVSWFLFSIIFKDKGNNYCRISMSFKKLTKLEMFQNNSLSGFPRKWCPYCEYEVFTYD